MSDSGDTHIRHPFIKEAALCNASVPVPVARMIRRRQARKNPELITCADCLLQLRQETGE